MPLTGGLDIVPDLTFDELGRLLGERRDKLDAVVIPALQPPAPAEFDSVNAWLRRQSAAGTLTVSVCAGARTLAATGLLDGRPATSHWTRLAGLRDDFRDVNWISGERYVDDGNVITTAGVLSGTDGALRIVERLVDMDAAREAAQAVHWRAAGLRPEYLHTTEEFAFDPVLRDIARTYDVQTARFAAKTLEYPLLDVELTGRAWPWTETLIPAVLALLGAAAAITTGIVFRRFRAASRRPQPLDTPTTTDDM